MSEDDELTIEEIDDLQQAARGRLIELNSERVLLVRNAVYSLEKLRMRFNEEMQEISDAFNDAVDDASGALAVGSRMMSDFTGDLLMDEFAIEELLEGADTEDEDE